MAERLRLARREWSSLRREKTIVLAIAIQLFVAAFSSFLVVGLVALYDPGAGGGPTVAVGVAGNASEDVAPVVDTGDSRRALGYADRAAAMAAFADRDVDAVLVATEYPSGLMRVDAVAPSGDFRTTLVVVQLKDALGALERQRRDALSSRLERRPLPVPADPGANPYFGFTYTVLLPLLVFLPVFVAGAVTTDSLVEEVDRGTVELLRVAPLGDAAVLEGKALANIALVPVQVGAWLTLLALNGTRIANPLSLLALATGVGTVVVVAGGVLALTVRDRSAAQLGYSLGVLFVFGLLTLLPANPVDAVAALAVGSATATTHGVAAAAVGAGVAAVALARWALARGVVTTG